MTEAEQRKIFSTNLKAILQQRGKRQIDIVEELNVAKSTVSGWCCGQKLPRMSKIEALARWLGVPISALLTDSAPLPTPEQRKVLELVSAITHRLETATPEELEKVMAMMDLFFPE